MNRGIIATLGAAAVASAVLGTGYHLGWFGPQPFILRGNSVPPGRLLGVVGLSYGSERIARCTGVLLAPDMVLTAAHCACDQRPTRIFVGHDTTSTTGGTWHRLLGGRYWRSALRCGTETTAQGVDIAVLRLASPVSAAQTLPIATDSLVNQASEFRIVGFGSEDPQGIDLPGRKMQGNIPVVSVDCTRSSDRRFGCQSGQEIVAGRDGTSDTCVGDSGGPLLVSTSGDAGRGSYTGLLVAGITSRGTDEDGPLCGNGGIYERLRPNVTTWVSSAMTSLRNQQ